MLSHKRRIGFLLCVLVVASLFLVPCGYIYLMKANYSSLLQSHQNLQPGMTREEVERSFSKNADLRYEGVKLGTEVLTEMEYDRCEYTLVFTNPYYLDPAIYCYFDADYILITSVCYE